MAPNLVASRPSRCPGHAAGPPSMVTRRPHQPMHPLHQEHDTADLYGVAGVDRLESVFRNSQSGPSICDKGSCCMNDLQLNRRQALLAGGLGMLTLGMPGAVMGSDKID